MVSLTTDPGNQDMVITIQRNCSLSWGQTKLAFTVLFAIIISVAFYFIALGAWLVAPFSGLEIALLGAGLYLSAHSGAKREIIRISSKNVVVYRGSKAVQEIMRFPRSWARVSLSTDPNNWYPSKLLLRSHGNSIEVGSDLIEAERIKLAGDLNEMLDIPSYVEKPDTQKKIPKKYHPTQHK